VADFQVYAGRVPPPHRWVEFMLADEESASLDHLV
jgi:hypothetical protein